VSAPHDAELGPAAILGNSGRGLMGLTLPIDGLLVMPVDAQPHFTRSHTNRETAVLPGNTTLGAGAESIVSLSLAIT
jgi:hypothetical protein